MVSVANGKTRQHAAVSADFEHELMREVLRTELIRVRAVILTAATLLLMFTVVYLIEPQVVERIWRGSGLFYPYLVLMSLIAFELWVQTAITHHLKLDRDVALVRRYIGAFIETSIPTIILALEIERIGSVQALGFMAPLAYFIFIILSTLHLNPGLARLAGIFSAAGYVAVCLYVFVGFPHVTAAQPLTVYFTCFAYAAFLSIGLLASSLTPHQIISALLAFVVLLLLWLADALGNFTQGRIGDLFRFLSITKHFDEFPRGVIDTRDILYFLTITAA